MTVLHLDLETASRLDLRKVGVSRYAQDPSTVVTVMAWAFDDDPVNVRLMPSALPDNVFDYIRQGGMVSAWNAAFEDAFLQHHWGLHYTNVSCTMQRSLYGGLPGKLADAADALRTPVRKDRAAHRLMLEMAKPRTRGPFAGRFWHEDPVEGAQKLHALGDYCKQDVEAERAIARMIPRLSPSEIGVSELDRRANRYGIRIDLPLVRRLIAVARTETAALDQRCAALTQGAVTSPGTQVAKLMKWLASEGCPVTDVGKEEIAETLETAVDADLPDEVIEVLSIRQKVAKSSVKKLQAMLATVDSDDRVRGTLQYYGASRTGRWSGRLIQPQNFPRPPRDYDPDDAIRAVFDGADADWLRTFFGEPLSVVSACLRGCLVPDPGNAFLVFDLSQIEARVLAWISGQNDILDVFRRGDDVYQWVADGIGLNSRQAGKVAVLGLGYGTGWKKFIELAKTYGLEIDGPESINIVTNWRQANHHIVQFWYDVDSTVRNVIGMRRGMPHRSTAMGLRDMVFSVTEANNGDPLLTIRLPSGKRYLCYRNIRLEPDPNHPGRDAITYDGVDQRTRKWGPVRSWGAKFVENIVQAIARDVIVEAAQCVERACPAAQLVLSVHDELVFEGPETALRPLAAAVKGIMEMSPAWAPDLPVACEGGCLTRYGKA